MASFGELIWLGAEVGLPARQGKRLARGQVQGALPVLHGIREVTLGLSSARSCVREEEVWRGLGRRGGTSCGVSWAG
jgi:hypothetical protein